MANKDKNSQIDAIDMSHWMHAASAISTGVAVMGAMVESGPLAGVFADEALFTRGASYDMFTENENEKERAVLNRIADALEKQAEVKQNPPAL